MVEEKSAGVGCKCSGKRHFPGLTGRIGIAVGRAVAAISPKQGLFLCMHACTRNEATTSRGRPQRGGYNRSGYRMGWLRFLQIARAAGNECSRIRRITGFFWHCAEAGFEQGRKLNGALVSERCRCQAYRSLTQKPPKQSGLGEWACVGVSGRGSGSARHTSGLEAPLQAKGYGG